MKARQMALSAELAARTARPIQDPGPVPGASYLTDAEYAELTDDALARAADGELWVFAYGSLLWKPACEVVERRPATVRGWHRSFCFKVPRFRGTPERPGLMMALDRGGQCKGMVLRLPPDRLRESLDQLFRREMTMKPVGNVVRWVEAQTPEGSLPALAFVVNRDSPRYVGRLALEEVAEVVATAAGHWGSCAQYLHETVSLLEQNGIRDRNLWRLQELVARRIGAAQQQHPEHG